MQYLNKFKEAAKFFTLTGNKILVERLDVGEVKTAGGLFLAESKDQRSDLRLQRPHVCVVVAVGEGYYNAESNSYTAMDVRPGNVVVLNSIGVQYYHTLPGIASYSNNQLGLSTENDLQLKFENIEAFQAYSKTMSGVAVEFK
jgi:co-chaperonin GroES (HSP10)